VVERAAGHNVQLSRRPSSTPVEIARRFGTRAQPEWRSDLRDRAGLRSLGGQNTVYVELHVCAVIGEGQMTPGIEPVIEVGRGRGNDEFCLVGLGRIAHIPGQLPAGADDDAGSGFRQADFGQPRPPDRRPAAWGAATPPG